ncbi:hypothetical protein Aph01nite_55780 [Acrocarpospora phusangensis]|uniref:Uncharacterized protein n=1 Tax=Acrocarpospora phusangensis TaxID=1070424 RepID=A0A919QGS5_9ACTN|nr:hypothetical protein Aph01nite_55780 [Acrocarpospora phusangensis]
MASGGGSEAIRGEFSGEMAGGVYSGARSSLGVTPPWSSGGGGQVARCVLAPRDLFWRSTIGSYPFTYPQGVFPKMMMLDRS